MSAATLIDRILERIKQEVKGSHTEPVWFAASVGAYGLLRRHQRRIAA